VSKWQDETVERNRQSRSRLTKALPHTFPSVVLSHALSRPFVPPTLRLAIDSYWRAHPIRADRLARSFAARIGAPWLDVADRGITLACEHKAPQLHRENSYRRHVKCSFLNAEADRQAAPPAFP
jgi:hypothetical protein